MPQPATHSLEAAVRQSPPIDYSHAVDDSWVKGKTIVITGGAGGFGEGFLRRWAAAGATVIIGDISVKKGDQVIRDVKKETGNPNLYFFHCNVTEWQSQVQFFKNAVKVSPHGGIDTVVANAGIVDPDPKLERPEGLDAAEPPPPNLAVLDVNLTGVVYTAHLALFYLPRNPNSLPASQGSDPTHSSRDRHLLLLSSMAGLSALPGQTLYSVSKHALVGLFRNLRSTSFTHGVRVNMLCPYFIDTPLMTTAGRFVLAGGAMGTTEDVVEAGTRLVTEPRIAGRAAVIGPKMRVIQDQDGEWRLVEAEEAGGERKAVWEVYAGDFEDSELFTRRYTKLLNRLVEVRGWAVRSYLITDTMSHSKGRWTPAPSAPSTPFGTPHAWSPTPSNKPQSLTSRKILLVAGGVIAIFIFNNLFFSHGFHRPHRPTYITNPVAYNATFLPNAAFQPPEPLPHRYSDTIDTFASYKYRNTCNISSLDLHAPFAPLCPDRKSMITAMSSGGRIGNDAPYMPRGCDMRWFTTEEICEILGRFEKVIILGDSMMRHVIGSINVLIRKDLGYGAVTDWNFSPEERKDCFCNYQFNVKACSIQGIFKTEDVVKNDPDSLACPANTIDVMIEMMIRFPIAPEELDRLRSLLPTNKPTRPYAFIFGHGLWNDLDVQATLDWLDSILETTLTQAPWLSPSTPSSGTKTGNDHSRRKEAGFWPRLFLTPNACGREKPDEWILSQGNKALMVFEESVGVEVKRRGLEHLGTWNATIQSNKFDGVHVDLKGNLVKAMMVMNWLNMLEVEEF